jgi:hypothetical protein
MLGNLFTGIAEGLVKEDKEARQIRLENVRAFNEQVRFASEMGMAPDPTELSKMAESITGGSNWQMAAMPGTEIRTRLSESLQRNQRERQASQEMRVIQGRQANDNYFTSVLGDFFMGNGKIEDVNPHLDKKFADSPATLQTAKTWLTGKDLPTLRSNFFASKVSELSSNIVAGDTPESVRSRYAGMPTEIVDKLTTVARAKQAEAARQSFPAMMNMVITAANNGTFSETGADGKAVFSQKAAEGWMKAMGIAPAMALNMMPAIRQSTDFALRKANVAAERDRLAMSSENVTALKAARQAVLEDPTIISRIVKEGVNFNPSDLRESLQRMAPGTSSFWDTPGFLENIVDGVREMKFQEADDNWVQAYSKARLKASEAADAKGGAFSQNVEAWKHLVSRDGKKDDTTDDILASLSTTLFLRPGMEGAAATITREIIKDAGKERVAAGKVAEDIANNLLRRGIAVPLQEYKTQWIDDMAHKGAGIKPQRFDTWYSGTTGYSGFQKAVGNEFQLNPQLRLSSAQTVEEFNQRKSALLNKLELAERQLIAETENPSKLYGFDARRVNAFLEDIRGYRRQISMREPPNIPRDEAERRQIDRDANRARSPREIIDNPPVNPQAGLPSQEPSPEAPVSREAANVITDFVRRLPQDVVPGINPDRTAAYLADQYRVPEEIAYQALVNPGQLPDQLRSIMQAGEEARAWIDRGGARELSAGAAGPALDRARRVIATAEDTRQRYEAMVASGDLQRMSPSAYTSNLREYFGTTNGAMMVSNIARQLRVSPEAASLIVRQYIDGLENGTIRR